MAPSHNATALPEARGFPADLNAKPITQLSDVALKMSRLCQQLRSSLDTSLPADVFVYRLANGIHDDLETLAIMEANCLAPFKSTSSN